MKFADQGLYAWNDRNMIDPPPPPQQYAQQIDRIYWALKDAQVLLETGRAYGFVVGLSPALAQQIHLRHGDEAASVLANVWSVDPQKPPHVP
jgi:hypothetical protein